MKVVCYYEKIEGSEYPGHLMARWHESWSRHGFKPEVVGMKQAQANPDWERQFYWVHETPTANDLRFEAHCWLRWLAYELAAPALFVDFDVINYGLKAEDVPPDEFTLLGAGVVHATQRGVRQFIDYWPKVHNTFVDGKPHMSDIIAIAQFLGAEHERRMGLCVLPDDVRVTTAPMVHFGNFYLPQEQKFNNRHLAIDALWAERRQTNKCSHCGAVVREPQVELSLRHRLPLCPTCADKDFV